MAGALLLLLLLLAAATAPSADAAVSRSAAAKKALAALGTGTSDSPVIVFGLRNPLRPRSVVGQAGPAGGSGRIKATTRFAQRRQQRIRHSGVQFLRPDVVMRAGSERVWFFYEDRGPHQNYEHPGRVVLVGARTGRVRTSSQLRWVPLVNGRQPAFFRSAKKYESKRFRVFSRPWTTQPPANRARTRQAPAGTASQKVADALAAEKSCAFRISDTLGDFFDFGRVDKTRARLGEFFEGLEALNGGFVSRRYTTKEGQTPIQIAQAMIDEAGCRDLLVYTAGAAARTGEAGIVIGMRNAPGGMEWHVLSADDLAALVDANPNVTFKFLFDVPYSGRVTQQLNTKSNVLITLASSGPDETSFLFVPEVVGPDGLVGNPNNPNRFLEFTNAIINGITAFVASDAEVEHGLANGGISSMMVWMLARGMGMSNAWMFSASSENLKLPAGVTPPAPSPVPPVLGGPPNHSPQPTTGAQSTREDTAKSFELTATDPDGDALTFSITDGPDHGDLTGSAPNLTYTPDQDYTGADSIEYLVEDGRGGSANGTVDIVVTPVNDAAAVTTTSGTPVTFTEDGSPVDIDSALTIDDPDSPQLEGATVRIIDGTLETDDELVFADQSGITGAYEPGELTLTGTASVADYQAALRSVQFDSTQQNPSTVRTIEFRAEDGDEAGAPAETSVTVEPVNDAPVLDPTDSALTYTEGDGPVAVDDGISLDDVDSADLTGATVQITGNFVEADDELAWSGGHGITPAYDDSTGTLTLSGTSAKENYENALRSITFANGNQNPSGTKTVSFEVTDANGTDNGGDDTSDPATRDISLVNANDAPVVTTSGGSTSYTEGDPATTVDGALTVTDADDANLDSGRVSVSNNFQSGDTLGFSTQNGIEGSYDGSTGVLTLTTPSGEASVADWQTALRSITFDHAGDNPSSGKQVEFEVNDGDTDSNAPVKGINLTGVNDVPTVNTSAGDTAYTEGGAAATVDGSLTISDSDDTNLDSGQVRISNGFESGDSLGFSPQNGIAGSYDAGTGVLTLSTPSGEASVADWQTALRSIQFSTTNDDPTASRTVEFQVNDGDGDSNAPTKSIVITPVNDAPVVTASGGSTSYTEGDSATAIDGALTVSDADDVNLDSGQVRISDNFESGDTLGFSNQNGIEHSYDAGTGVLTLTTPSGEASKADWQTALRSVTFADTADDDLTSPKTVEFKVNDGDTDSNLATKNIAITAVNDAPTLDTTGSDLAYTEGDGPVAIDGGLTASDPDSTNLAGATVEISNNFVQADDGLAFADTANIDGEYDDTTGTLTLTGSDTVANYQAALRSVTYTNSSDDPSSATRTVSFQVDDGAAANNLSNSATRDITVAPVNDAPVVTTTGGSTSYTEGGSASAVDNGLTVSDADDADVESGQVRISNGFESGDTLHFTNQNGIEHSYNSGTGVLTLTTPSGESSKADWQTALRSVTFSTTNDDPGTSKTVEFKVNDGDTDSNLATKNLTVTPVNDAPTMTTTATALSYTEGDGADPIDGGLTLTDPDSTQIQGAKVWISAGHVQADDQLAVATQNGISGSYDDATGTLTLTGTTSPANYQAALRSVTYENVNQDPSGSKTVSFQATDAEGADSNTATRDINLTGANDAPVVTTSSGNTPYTEGDVATPVDPGLTVSDPDDTSFDSGEVRIASNFQAGDVLTFSPQNGIAGAYDPATGELTLTTPSGEASKADWQAALRSVTYSHAGDDPSPSKTVDFMVNDGTADSNRPVKGLDVTGVNDAPTVNTSGGTTAFTEDGGPVAVDNALTVTDPESDDITGATVSITGGFDDSEDVLASAGNAEIDASYSPTTGVLTLTGSDTPANYQAVLRAVTYDNSDSAAPDTTTRTISFQVKDTSDAASNTATKDVSVTQTNDPPVVTTTSGSTPYTEDDPAVAVDSGITVTDAEDTDLNSGRVRISSGLQAGDTLSFTPTANITGSYDSGTGIFTLDTPVGEASIAEWETALRSVKFGSTQQQPVTSKTIEFKVNDGDTDSNLATKEIAVTPVNDPPIVNATDATLAYTENDPATAVDSGLTVVDGDADLVSGGSASITANYAAGQDFLAWTDNNLSDNITQDNVNTTSQTVVLTGLDTDANYQAALRAVTYRNSSDNPTTSNRTVTFSATDQPGLTGSDTRTISVAAVDDPPAAVNDSDTVLEDASATSIPVLTNDTDVDGGPKTISSATDPANGTVVLTGGSSGAHTGLTYQPDSNYCNDPPGTTPDTFTYTLNGGDTATVSMTVTCVNDAPVADDETFNGNDSAHGNTTMQVDDPDDNKSAPTSPHTEITGDILAGDTDVDNAAGELTVTPGTFATNDGGSVTLESDGDFVFQPVATTSCTDTSDFFDYTVEDNGSPEMTDTGRVTIAIAGCVWYVHNNSPGNSGTSNAPFDTLAQAESASGTNHTVFVFDGDNAATGHDAGGYAMNSGERLIGEHEGLTVDPDQGGSLSADSLRPANAGAHPTLTSTGAGLDVIDLDDGNEIRGFNIDPQTGHGGIQGTTGDTGGATIDDVNIVDTFGTNGTQAGLELNGTTGTFNISNFTVDNNATGVLLNNAGTVDFAGDSGVVTLDSIGGPALSATSTNMGTSNFDDIITSSSTGGGVILSSASGTINLGDGAGTDLNLTTTSGPTPALSIASSGTITVGSGGTDELHATGGPAIDVTGTSGATFDFDDVDSTNSANDGINLDGLGTGTFNAAAGDIGGYAGIGFDVNGGTATITNAGNLNDGGGTTAVEVTGRNGGTVTQSGPINDDNDNGGGIVVNSNTGGATTLNNATKVLNTGANDGVTFTSSDGHTLNLFGGGLDIDTTSGNGLNATTAGTLSITGSGNTINATGLGASNRALNVADTDFAVADATFQGISSVGGISGIRLNNTGTAGNLNIAGTGADDSGGAISNTSADAVSLTNTDDFTADEMNIQNPARDGFSGTGVTNFTVTDSYVNNAGQSDVDITDSAFAFNTTSSANENNIDGNVTITGNTITNPYGGGVDIFNHNGTISNLNVSNNTLTSGTGVGAVPGTGDNDSVEDAIQVVTFGGNGFAANLTAATVDNNNIVGFPDGTGIEFLGGSQGTGSTGYMGTPGTANKVVISNNLIRGHSSAIPMGQNGIVADVEGRGGGHFEITNNGTQATPIANVLGSAILAGNAGDADAEFEITGNRADLDTSIAGSSGIGIGTDKDIIADGSTLADPDINVNVANNVVTDSAGSAIRVLHRDSNGTINLKMQNNEARSRANNGTPGISINNGSSGDNAFDPTMCAIISGNTAEGAIDGFGDKHPGIELFKRVGAADTDGSYTFGIQGLTPSPATGAQAEDYVATQNPASVTGNSADMSGFFNKKVKVRSGNHFESCTVPGF